MRHPCLTPCLPGPVWRVVLFPLSLFPRSISPASFAGRGRVLAGRLPSVSDDGGPRTSPRWSQFCLLTPAESQGRGGWKLAPLCSFLASESHRPTGETTLWFSWKFQLRIWQCLTKSIRLKEADLHLVQSDASQGHTESLSSCFPLTQGPLVTWT